MDSAPPVVSSSAPLSMYSDQLKFNPQSRWCELSLGTQKVQFEDKKTNGSGAIGILNLHFAEMEFVMRLCVLLLLVRVTTAMQCSALEIQQLLGDYSEACTHHFASAVLLTARLADLHVAYNRSLVLINQV